MSNVCRRCVCCQCHLNMVLSAIAKCVGRTALVSLVVTTVTSCSGNTLPRQRGVCLCAFLQQAWHYIFESLYRLPSHVMYISQSLYWCCLYHILTCSAPGMFVVHMSSLTMHTIHMRCGSWASMFDLMMCSTLPCQMSAGDVFVANAT